MLPSPDTSLSEVQLLWTMAVIASDCLDSWTWENISRGYPRENTNFLKVNKVFQMNLEFSILGV